MIHTHGSAQLPPRKELDYTFSRCCPLSSDSLSENSSPTSTRLSTRTSHHCFTILVRVVNLFVLEINIATPTIIYSTVCSNFAVLTRNPSYCGQYATDCYLFHLFPSNLRYHCMCFESFVGSLHLSHVTACGNWGYLHVCMSGV